MTKAHSVDAVRGASSDAKPGLAGLGMAKWLGLAATPIFALMALLTAALGGGAREMICSAEHMSPLTGMVPMYLLMSVFHSPPWLKLISSR